MSKPAGGIISALPLIIGGSSSSGKVLTTYGTEFADLGINLSSWTCFSFEVNSCSSASLALSTDPGNYSVNVYEFEFSFDSYPPFRFK